jgi:hypothetical protein
MTNTQRTHSVIRESTIRDRSRKVEVWRVASIKRNGVGLLFSIPVRDDETGKDDGETLKTVWCLRDQAVPQHDVPLPQIGDIHQQNISGELPVCCDTTTC